MTNVLSTKKIDDYIKPESSSDARAPQPGVDHRGRVDWKYLDIRQNPNYGYHSNPAFQNMGGRPDPRHSATNQRPGFQQGNPYQNSRQKADNYWPGEDEPRENRAEKLAQDFQDRFFNTSMGKPNVDQGMNLGGPPPLQHPNYPHG